ncbi:MAG TPA: hypothetical protein VGK74_04650 [Symbiobacteriaceae bacterium]
MSAVVVPLRRFEEPMVEIQEAQLAQDSFLPALAVVAIVLIVAVAAVATVAMITGHAISWDVQVTSYFHWKSCVGSCSH